jgi:hypothetical protein
METESGSSGNTTDPSQCTKETIRRELRSGYWERNSPGSSIWKRARGAKKRKNPEGTEIWILGEELTWFIYLEEGQRGCLERRNERIRRELRSGYWERNSPGSSIWKRARGAKKRKNPEETEIWILGEELTWFIHLEEGQRDCLERRNEKTSST